uniref:C2H2-type domain-containing protein n=1 Tax=Chelonoidis abingdonii TaxID=106734 RepID=A0A8C0G967_CHEAB
MKHPQQNKNVLYGIETCPSAWLSLRASAVGAEFMSLWILGVGEIDRISEGAVPGGVAPYNCPQCGRSFSTSARFKTHQSTHLGERVFHCSEGGEGFQTHRVLQVHQRTHAGEKLHVCNDCGRSFSCKQTLRVHKRIHTGEKPYRSPG